MSRIDAKNIFEQLVVMNAFSVKTDVNNNVSETEQSTFFNFFEGSHLRSDVAVSERSINKKTDAGSSEYLAVEFVGNNLEQSQLLNNISIVTETLLIDAPDRNYNSELVMGDFLMVEGATLQDEIINNIETILLQGEYKIQNDEVVMLNGQQLEQNKISDLHEIVVNVIPLIFNNEIIGQEQTVFVLSQADDNQSVMKIWVPLTAFATGHLTQSNNFHLAESVYSLDNTLNGKELTTSKMVSHPVDRYVASSQSGEVTQVLSNRQNSIHQISKNNSGANSTINDIKQTSVQHYNSLSSQVAHEFLSKKYTFFANEEGLTIWYRDYESSDSSIKDNLSQLKNRLEKYYKIKLIGYNGKTLYSNDGGDYAS